MYDNEYYSIDLSKEDFEFEDEPDEELSVILKKAKERPALEKEYESTLHEVIKILISAKLKIKNEILEKENNYINSLPDTIYGIEERFNADYDTFEYESIIDDIDSLIYSIECTIDSKYSF